MSLSLIKNSMSIITIIVVKTMILPAVLYTIKWVFFTELLTRPGCAAARWCCVWPPEGMVTDVEGVQIRDHGT